MAHRSHWQLRLRRFALRFFAICLIQSAVITYLVLDVTGNQTSTSFLSLQAAPSTNQASLYDELACLWTRQPHHPSLGFSGDIRPPSPSDGQAEPARQALIERIVADYQVGFSKQEVSLLARVIDDESRRYRHDPRLLLAVILTESSLRKGSISSQGALGLMQIKPALAVELASRPGCELDVRTSLLDPAYNIRLGTLHLSELISKYGDTTMGLVAYNLGETAMRSRLAANRRLPSQYVRRVMSKYEELLEKYPDA